METRSKKRFNITLSMSCKVAEDSSQTVTLADGNKFATELFDISTLGVGFFSRYFLPQGLIVEIEIGGVLKDPKALLKVKGKICHCNYLAHDAKATHKYKCGLQFLNISKEDEKELEAFIVSHEQRKVPRLGVNGHNL